MSQINLNILTDEEVLMLDFALYEQLVRLIRVQHRQKSHKRQHNINILQNLRLKISKRHHSRCNDKDM